MSIKYTITLHNDHGKDGRYAFFVDPPQVSESLTAPEVFTNAWISTFVPNGSTHDITTTSEMFACKSTWAITDDPKERSLKKKYSFIIADIIYKAIHAKFT
jgi:hypothetical protein